MRMPSSAKNPRGGRNTVPARPASRRMTRSRPAVKLGPYMLERRLAVGGMAEVFLSRIEGPASFAKRIALKRILPHFSSDSRFIEMFIDEARLAARFAHQNLVQAYELTQ